MNPFDLRGPEFLVFYAFLGAAVLAAIALRRWLFEPQAPVSERLTDPTSIAYLRAGSKEVLRLTILSMIERGLLESNGPKLESKTVRDHRELPALERLVLDKFARQGEASAVFSDASLERECKRVRESLEVSGLVPDASQRALRWWSTCAGIAVLAIVASIKIQVALARGRTNVLFLIVLAIAFTIGAVLLARLPRTPRGSAMIRDLRALLEQARRRYLDPSSSAELALVAATFGVAGLPDSIQASRAQQLFPKGSSSSSGCGASWGTGCGSSCGSSCGGGCGGGCGGCGS